MSDDEPVAKQQPLRTLDASQPRRKFATLNELILAIVLITVAIVLTVIVVNKISRNHVITSAKPVADKAIAAFDKRDGNAIRSLGSPYFQKVNSAASLTKGSTSVEIATLKTPTLDQQVEVNAHDGRVVYFIYKYSALKVPFYVRVDVQQQNGHWYLTALNGDINESSLLTNS